MKNNKILVTGGTGLIGRNLIPLLVKQGYVVTVLDQFEFNFNSSSILDQFEFNFNSSSIKFVKSDFNNDSIVIPLLKNNDIVIHLAAMIGVDNCRLNPEKVVEVNNKNTKKFFNNCQKYGVKKIIFSSSSEVYGNSDEVPFKEDGKLSPYSDYGKNKLFIEKYLKKLQQKTGISVGIARFFNVYGPGQKEIFVVPIFIKNCLENKPIIVHGDGEQIRCFTYVNDAVKGLVALCEYNKSPYEIFNIGRHYEYTMMDLAKAVKQALPKSKSKIILMPYGQDGIRSATLEVKRRVPSVEKAKNILGFEATTSLERGLQKTIKFYIKKINETICQ